MVSALWPLSRSYEYVAEIGLMIRLKRPALWQEWESDSTPQHWPMRQAAGLEFVRWLEVSKEAELRAILPSLVATLAPHLRSELTQSYLSLSRDYAPKAEDAPYQVTHPFHAGRRARVRVVEAEGAPHTRSEWTQRLLSHTDLRSAQSAPLTPEQITLAHSHHYWRELCSQARAQPALATPETLISERSPQVSLAAAGAVLEAARWALREPNLPVWASASPGSHHAARTRAGGTCVINNLAVAALTLLRERAVSRVAVLDIDAHHGNGTEQIFYQNPDVLTVSVHQHPFFPGTGERAAKGQGAGYGTNRNYPLAAGASARDWERAVELGLVAVRRFRPQLILIQLSSDAHHADPVSDLNASDQSFARCGELVMQCARACRAGVACELGNSLSERAWLGALGELAHACDA